MFILCHGIAWGHAGAQIDSIDINGPFADKRVGLETTVGYLRGNIDGQFSWFCHEAVTQADALITPRYVENADGVLLATIGDTAQARDTNESLYRSTDGCNWNAPEGLTGQQIAAAAFETGNPNHALAITANEDGHNRLYQSTDAGLTWAPTDLIVENRTFRSVRFGTGSTHSVWLSAVRHETDQAWIYHSTDSGASWAEHEIDVLPADGLDVYVDVIIADHTNPNRAWVVMGPYLDDQLLETTDGGHSFVEVYAPDGDIIDGAQDGSGALWLVTTGNKVIVSETGDFFERRTAAPLSLGVTASGSDIFLANRIPSEGHALSVSGDGIEFLPIDVFGSLNGPPECTPDSHSTAHCEPIWPDLDAMIVDEPDTGSPSSDAPHGPGEEAITAQGCCSDQHKQSNAGLLVFLLFGLQRRKHNFGVHCGMVVTWRW
mgnify:CR=1 FL=1